MHSPFKSIESRHGVDAPGYMPPPEPSYEPDRSPPAHVLTGWEVVVAVLIPVFGLGVAIWRFGRGDIGPGIADLLLCAVGCAIIAWLLVR